MSEYIEREAATAVIEEKQKELCPVGMYSRHAVYGSDREKFDAWQEIIDALERIPAADVRPVVLCRDCYAYRRDKELAEAAYLDPEMYCGLLRCEMGEDSFCSYGKRKEES